jgi:hypothetical protein
MLPPWGPSSTTAVESPIHAPGDSILCLRKDYSSTDVWDPVIILYLVETSKLAAAIIWAGPPWAAAPTGYSQDATGTQVYSGPSVPNTRVRLDAGLSGTRFVPGPGCTRDPGFPRTRTHLESGSARNPGPGYTRGLATNKEHSTTVFTTCPASAMGGRSCNQSTHAGMQPGRRSRL